MKAFFEGLEDLFVSVLFAPYDFLRFMGNWWVENTLNWLFVIIGFAAFIYWMLQLKKYNKTEKEDESISAHSYL